MLSPTKFLNAAESPVKAVTIFQSATAELTRTFTVELVVGTYIRSLGQGMFPLTACRAFEFVGRQKRP
ncbi:hypothetical protein L227DRAFT_534095 [Lentinus tigrinus ALCF2SS1-6]|uniref:Uncharacterized protein n=1 Tax=Lentinus tigrinus ALCF2SS1-6 TaxID=1328759 RepID=A0A5C2RW88_9APHY|nr:hypothetical protein L227DRAFT_534095 [Lentinus tigrinus ALCF2SS1-6]